MCAEGGDSAVVDEEEPTTHSENEPAESTTRRKDPGAIESIRLLINFANPALLVVRSSLSRKKAVTRSALSKSAVDEDDEETKRSQIGNSNLTFNDCIA